MKLTDPSQSWPRIAAPDTISLIPPLPHSPHSSLPVPLDPTEEFLPSIPRPMPHRSVATSITPSKGNLLGPHRGRLLHHPSPPPRASPDLAATAATSLPFSEWPPPCRRPRTSPSNSRRASPPAGQWRRHRSQATRGPWPPPSPARPRPCGRPAGRGPRCS